MKKIFVKSFLIVFTILCPVTLFAATVDFTFKNTTSSCGTTNVILVITDAGGPTSKKYQIFSIPTVGPWNYEGATTGSEYTVNNVSSTTTYLVRMVDANNHDSKVVDSDPHTFTIINVNKPTLSIKNGGGTYVSTDIDKCISSGGNVNVDFQVNNLTAGATYALIKDGGETSVTPDGDGKFTFTTSVSFGGGTSVTHHYKIKATVGACPAQTSDQEVTVIFKLNPTPVLTLVGGGPICMNGDAQQTFNFNVSPNISGYKLSVNNGVNEDIGLNGSGSFSKNLQISFGQGGQISNTFKVINPNGCLNNQSNTVTVNVYRNPAVTERAPAGSPIPVILKVSDGDYDLANAFNTIPSWVKISSASGPGVFPTTAGSKWAVKPDQSSVKEINDAIQYTMTNTGANCSISGTIMNTDITIIDDQATLPDFIKPIFPLPICSREKDISLYASIKNTAFINLPDTNEIAVEVQYDGSPTWTKIVAKRIKVDDYSNNILFQFKIEPNRHSNYSIPVRIVDFINPGNADLYNKSYKIPIFPSPEPSISGLSAFTKADTVYFCSASADTLFMRSNPSGGTYSFSLFTKKLDGTYDTTDLSNADIRIPSYTEPSKDDPSLEKFVPAMIFNNHIKSGSLNDFISVVYTGPNPCPGQVRRIFKFKVPVDISYSSKDTICYGDQLELKLQGNYTVGDTILWAFGDGEKTQSTNSTLNYRYAKPGKYLLRFQTAISDLGDLLCNNDIVDSVFVGAKPTASFDIYNNYLGDSVRLESRSKILVLNTPEAKDTIVAWNWKFSGDLTDLQGDSVSFGSPDVTRDPYQVLHITTASWGCSDTAILSMPIFPVHTVSPDDFDKEQFNTSSKNGWYHTGQYYEDETKSSWRNVPPNGAHIKAISPGDAAWFTSVSGKGGYNAGETSWVESPVYEIGNLQLPMLSMDTWTDMNYPFDGVAVQFAFVDTTAFGKEKWQTLGEMDGEGLNWYNFNSVSGSPGNEGHGWTDNKSGKWTLSAYRLDTILKLSALDPGNRKRVRFRIVLGTTTIGQDMDGFAFDNFFVGQRNRKIIVEEFCDHKNEFDKPEAIFIDPQALRIQYHLSDLTTEEEDEINSQNPYEPSARGLLYGIGKTLPRVVLDGIFYNNNDPYDITKINDFNRGYTRWINTSLLERSLITSPYTIKLDTTYNEDSLKIETTIEKSQTVTEQKNYVVQVAIVEKVVQGNGKEFTNVLRQMVPNSAGHRIDKNFVWTTTPVSETTTINASWKPTIKPTSDIYVIAFLQDEDTKEIYQSDYLSVALADYQNLYSGARPGSASAKVSFSDLTLSPNPTSHDLMVKFDGVLKDDYTWSIIDVLGNQRNTGLMLYGTEAKMLNTEQLGTGMYYLKLEGEGRSFIKKFSVVK